jgi:hypothetical protein
MKQMNRLMLTSSTYRQASTVTEEEQRLDGENVLLSRMPLRRMEGEVLNDTLTYIAGRLDETRFGVPAPVLVRDDGLVTPIETEKGWRRSIYTEQRRSEIPTLLDNFDLPPMSPNCIERMESTVSLQALYLSNNGMVKQLAEATARQLASKAGLDPQKQIDQLYWLALSRPPTSEEAKASLETLLKLKQLEPKDAGELAALAKLCHIIFNSAAFIYID